MSEPLPQPSSAIAPDIAPVWMMIVEAQRAIQRALREHVDVLGAPLPPNTRRTMADVVITLGKELTERSNQFAYDAVRYCADRDQPYADRMEIRHQLDTMGYLTMAESALLHIDEQERLLRDLLGTFDLITRPPNAIVTVHLINPEAVWFTRKSLDIYQNSE